LKSPEKFLLNTLSFGAGDPPPAFVSRETGAAD